jgi:hypothetical protein
MLLNMLICERNEQDHRQYEAVCDVAIEQPDYWLEDEIRV